MANEKQKHNIIDLGYVNGWKSDGIENRLCEMVRLAGYHFTEVSRNERGSNTVYECKEAGLRYHVDSSD